MFDEDDLLPISALQHLAFCERQCALIHIEGIWQENRFTAEGRVLHERTHEPETESRGDLRVARGLRLRSLRLGLTGVADVVEFHRLPDTGEKGTSPEPVGTENVFSHLAPRASHRLPGSPGLWRPFPVEHKRGRPKPDHCDTVQLCAQALCIEEMLGVAVPEGAMFYGQPRRRLDVPLDDALRRETEALAERLHALIAEAVTPPAAYEKKCGNCSLLSQCMPRTAGARRSASRWLAAGLAEAIKDGDP